MSHFSVAVILPPVACDPERAVAELLAPFDENTHVDPYEEEADIEWWRDKEKAKARGITASSPLPELFAAYVAEYGNDEGMYLKDDGNLYRKSQYNQNSKWDWWQIGGRWTGAFDGYNPEEDLANQETCSLCRGTGRRPDAEKFDAQHPGWMEQMNGCNGCLGKGISTKWPTRWRNHSGDVTTVDYVLEAKPKPTFAIVTPEQQWIEQGSMGWWGMVSDEKEPPVWDATFHAVLSKYRGHRVVVVDCHI